VKFSAVAPSLFSAVTDLNAASINSEVGAEPEDGVGDGCLDWLASAVLGGG
jgi:hypothetical protein